MYKFSIIIPTYNEACYLPLLLSDLTSIHKDIEILIIDCGSQDKTIDIAKIYGAKIYKAEEKNRGLQLNIGANKSKGDWLVFLHSDSRLSRYCLKKIKKILKGKDKYIYAFKLKINDKKITYRFLEILINLRSIILKKPYGDQGLVINRKTYFNNNGFSKIPLMEDIDFLKRLKNKRNLKILNCSIFTSSRKWEKTNIFLQAIKNWRFRRRWLKGESIYAIYNDYYKK